MKKFLSKLGIISLLMLGAVSFASTKPIHTTAATQVRINKKNFPDEKFRWYVKRFDKNKNGYLSKKEIKAVKKMEVSEYLYAGWVGTAVLNVKGMEYFTNVRELGMLSYRLKNFDISNMKKLESLSLADSHLKVLDLRKHKNLRRLWLFKNNITKIKFASSSKLRTFDIDYEKKLQKPDFASLKKLENLYAQDMPYKKLDLRKCKNLKDFELRYLGVLQGKDNGALQKISFGESNKKLKTIVIIGGRLASADWLCKLPDLETLALEYNNLTALDVTKNSKLQNLYCNGNKLSVLDLSGNSVLKKLDCSENKISDLDLSRNSMLEELRCSENNLSSLDLSGNSMLRELRCNKNPLTSLDVSQLANLIFLDCSNCQLTALDTSSNKKLTTLNSEGNPIK